MLVTFVGAPISGKTTASAWLFADLKEQGWAVEYLSEYARQYIAQKRMLQGDALVLGDLDQAAILHEQYLHEKVMTHDPKVLVVADSCAMSALLYMTPGYIERIQAMPDSEWYGGVSPLTMAKQCAASCDIIFRCSPVRPGPAYDPNRVHNFEQAVEIDKRLNSVFDLCGVDRSKVFPLFGDTKLRLSEARAVLMPRLIQRLVATK